MLLYKRVRDLNIINFSSSTADVATKGLALFNLDLQKNYCNHNSLPCLVKFQFCCEGINGQINIKKKYLLFSFAFV